MTLCSLRTASVSPLKKAWILTGPSHPTAAEPRAALPPLTV